MYSYRQWIDALTPIKRLGTSASDDKALPCAEKSTPKGGHVKKTDTKKTGRKTTAKKRTAPKTARAKTKRSTKKTKPTA